MPDMNPSIDIFVYIYLSVASIYTYIYINVNVYDKAFLINIINNHVIISKHGSATCFNISFGHNMLPILGDDRYDDYTEFYSAILVP